MSDWDTVTIGSKARAGQASKETVVRGKGALNAAQRSGLIVGQEKKFAVGNAVSLVIDHRQTKQQTRPHTNALFPLYRRPRATPRASARRSSTRTLTLSSPRRSAWKSASSS